MTYKSKCQLKKEAQHLPWIGKLTTKWKFLPGWEPLVLLLLSYLFIPLLGRTRSRGRCWAAIRLSHGPELSGHAVHGEVDGLDIGGQHGRRLFFCATLTGHRGGHTPFVQAGAETSNIGAEAVKLDPGSSWEGHSGGWVLVSGMKMRSLVGLSTHSAFHWLSVHCAACMLSDELMRCCAGGTYVCLDLRRHAFALDG